MKFAEIALYVLLVTVIYGQLVVAAEIDACDIQAGHPLDPGIVGDGKETNDVVTHVAIPACRAAVQREPGNPRFHYQLGRALYYWAGANDEATGESIHHIDIAAEMGYTQAMFVRGLLHKYANENCPAEPLMKAAADNGLKSASFTYVDDVTAGYYDGCNISATRTEMREYLATASGLAAGYYEDMLVQGLKKKLADRDEAQ